MMAHFVASTLIIILDDFITLKCEENFNKMKIYIYREIHVITILQSLLVSLWKLSGERKYSYVIKKFSIHSELHFIIISDH